MCEEFSCGCAVDGIFCGWNVPVEMLRSFADVSWKFFFFSFSSFFPTFVFFFTNPHNFKMKIIQHYYPHHAHSIIPSTPYHNAYSIHPSFTRGKNTAHLFSFDSSWRPPYHWRPSCILPFPLFAWFVCLLDCSVCFPHCSWYASTLPVKIFIPVNTFSYFLPAYLFKCPATLEYLHSTSDEDLHIYIYIW